MTALKKVFILLFITAFFSNCNKLIFREIECNPFEMNVEYFWNSSNEGEKIVFTNSLNQRKELVVADKTITHRTKYVSDTGCGCYDFSGMLMTNGSDSIWFKNELQYIENQIGENYTDIVFSIEGQQSLFYEVHSKNLPTYIIDSITFKNVLKLEYDYNKRLNVKAFYLVKNLGIIRFEMVNGEVWTNENLTEFRKNTIEDFNYTENICD
jgi:hypothetical protein